MWKQALRQRIIYMKIPIPHLPSTTAPLRHMHPLRFMTAAAADGLYAQPGCVRIQEEPQQDFRTSHEQGARGESRHGRRGRDGKIDTITEPVTALLAMKTGRPVKLVYNRRRISCRPGPDTEWK